MGPFSTPRLFLTSAHIHSFVRRKYDFDNDEGWNAYLSRVEIPNDSEALMLKLKAKYYRREIVSTGLVLDQTCLCVCVLKGITMMTGVDIQALVMQRLLQFFPLLVSHPAGPQL